MQMAVKSLASLHAAIRSGHVISSSTHLVLDGQRESCYAPLTFNHAGDYALCQRNYQLQLHRLDINAESHTTELVWTRPAPYGLAGTTGRCRIFWATNDCWAAVKYDIKSSRERRRGCYYDGPFNVMYIMDIDTNEIFEITQSEAFKNMVILTAPCIAPDSNLMLVPWTGPDSSHIHIYNRAERKVIATVPGTYNCSQAESRDIGFAPDSLHFAVARDNAVYLYASNGHLESVLTPAEPAEFIARGQLEQLAWSPDGSKIALWQPARPQKLYIFNAGQGLLEKLVLLDVEQHATGLSLLWSPYSLLLVVSSGSTNYIDQRRFEGSFFSLLDTLLICCDSEQHHHHHISHVQMRLGPCMPVFSPDGAFLAILGSEGHHIQFFDAKSGGCVAQQAVVIELLQRDPVLLLAWPSMGRNLILHVQAPDFHNQLTQELMTVIKL